MLAESSKNSVEPDLNQRPMDVLGIPLQSTALPTELSTDTMRPKLHQYIQRKMLLHFPCSNF